MPKLLHTIEFNHRLSWQVQKYRSSYRVVSVHKLFGTTVNSKHDTLEEAIAKCKPDAVDDSATIQTIVDALDAADVDLSGQGPESLLELAESIKRAQKETR